MSDNTQAAADSAVPTNTKLIPIKAIDTGHGRMALMPTDFDQVWRIATLFARAENMVPKDYQGKAEMIATAIMWGMELGLTPINAVNSIAIIKGRASLWGDAMLAVCIKHPDFVDMLDEKMIEQGPNGPVEIGYRVIAKRNGRKDVMREFTLADAAKAGLIRRASGQNGDGPWITYPIRMCWNRARSWALRDQFPDALKGIASADELRDVIEGESVDVTHTKTEPANSTASMPRAKAVAHEHNPLNDLSRVVEATPDLAVLHAAQATPKQHQSPIDFSDLESPEDLGHARPSSTTTAAGLEKGAGDSEDGLFSPPKPLTSGQAKLLQIYLTDAAQYGVTEQDLFDELGDRVHQGNLQRAQEWLEVRIGRKSK